MEWSRLFPTRCLTNSPPAAAIILLRPAQATPKYILWSRLSVRGSVALAPHEPLLAPRVLTGSLPSRTHGAPGHVSRFCAAQPPRAGAPLGGGRASGLGSVRWGRPIIRGLRLVGLLPAGWPGASGLVGGDDTWRPCGTGDGNIWGLRVQLRLSRGLVSPRVNGLRVLWGFDGTRSRYVLRRTRRLLWDTLAHRRIFFGFPFFSRF
jgi:hypothetical protein